MSRIFDRWLIAAIIVAIVLLVTLWCGPVYPAVIAEAPMGSGAIILLHDEPGPCRGEALLAEFIDAERTTPGCWVLRGTHVAIVFLDGDVGSIPKTALRQPRKT